MGIRTRLPAVAVVFLATLSINCNPEADLSRHEREKEYRRYWHLQVFGPYQVSSVVGFSAPIAGYPGLTSAFVDQAWCVRYRSQDPDVPETEIPLSPFELPDPNRPFKRSSTRIEAVPHSR